MCFVRPQVYLSTLLVCWKCFSQLILEFIFQLVLVMEIYGNLKPMKHMKHKTFSRWVGLVQGGPYGRYKWSYGAPINGLVNRQLGLFHPYIWSYMELQHYPPSMVVSGSPKRWDRWHIIPQLAVYTTYIPLIVLAFWRGPYATDPTF